MFMVQWFRYLRLVLPYEQTTQLESKVPAK